MQKARRQTVLADMVLRLLVSARVQDLFHSPPGVLFSVRSRYSCTIGLSGVFRLRAWSPQIHAEFHEPCVTQVPARKHTTVTYGTITPYGQPFQVILLCCAFPYRRPYNPRS
jgi:hypothetical protein